jgi:RND family efflux transporter MFP subunit
VIPRLAVARTLAAVSIAGLATVACGADRQAAPAPPQLPPISVRVAIAERAAADRRVELTGVVAAEKSSAVSSRVTAMVTAVHVALGDEVRAGQTLVSIDPSAAQGQVTQAQGALAQAEAGLGLARRNLERYQALAATGSASELELDLARTQFAEAEGAVEQARGALASARSVARESTVVAPFAGRVTARPAEVGDLAAPGRPLAVVESLAGRRLVVAVPETIAQAAALRHGVELAVRLDARPDLGEIAGRVVEVAPGPDPVTHAVTVRVDLPAATGEIAAGAAGRAFVAVGSSEAVRVPREALIESGGLTLVVVRDEAGRAESRVVTAGAVAADGRVEIFSGLAGGETVALGLSAAPPAGTPLEATP